MRRDLAERQRQRRGGDPAGKMALQLLVLLSAGLALLPPMRTFGFSFGLPARRPTSSIDDDKGPTAHAMERGLEPLHYAVTPRPAPTWTRLVKDLKRPRTADRARALLEKRVPPAAIEWLRVTIEAGEFWQLRRLGLNGATDDDIAAAALTEAQAWEAAQQQAEAEATATPGAETPDDEPDATGPKP